MNAPYRRLACPGLADPMETGDGFLARLVPSGQTIALDAFASLCAAARAYGSGIIEVTARGNIQVRGLRPDTISAFAADVGALDIATDGVPMTVDPLAGLGPHAALDACAMANALRTALAQAPFTAQLGPKVSVIIDAGNTLHLDALADIRLRPKAPANTYTSCWVAMQFTPRQWAPCRTQRQLMSRSAPRRHCKTRPQGALAISCAQEGLRRSA